MAFTLRGVYAAIDISIVIAGLPISELGRFLERRLEPDRRAICKDWQAWLRETFTCIAPRKHRNAGVTE
jgi:hypothetical protein